MGLDDPINDHLSFEVTHPDAPGADITTRQLMAHTSGIVDNWDALETHYVTGDSEEALGNFLQGYLVSGGADYDAFENFHPDGVGQITEYSNSGAALAGYMVQAATGTPFDAFCDARLFEALDLNAGWHLADFDAEQVASPTEYTSRGVAGRRALWLSRLPKRAASGRCAQHGSVAGRRLQWWQHPWDDAPRYKLS